MKHRILIVEDNELNLKLFYDLLIIKNYDVITSKEGIDILNRVIEHKPDLVLMDIQLNDISGIDIIKELKANNLTKHIPVIAISAFAMKHEELKILQSGCNLYLSKPVSIDRFFEAVHSFFC